MTPRDVKDELALTYSSAQCPACGAKKMPLRWLCQACRDATTPSPENDEVTVNCERHVAAVQGVIALAKRLHEP